MMIINPYRYSSGIIYPADLLAFYKGESNGNDEIGSNHATPGAQTAYNTGQSGGNAFVFNGNALSGVAVPSINVGGLWSLEFYMYRTTAALAQHLFSNSLTGASNLGAFYTNSANQLTYFSNNLERVRTGAVITDNTWIKVLLTYDGAKNRIWVNDVLRAIETNSHSETWNNSAVIGYTNSAESSAFTGRIDEVKIYNTARTGTLGLIAHYAGENNTNDASGSYNATPGAGTAYGTGQTGNAFSFTGNTNQKVTIPQILLGDKYSIEFYMKPNNNASGFKHTISNSFNAAGVYGALYFISTNKLEYWQGNSARATTANSSITVGSWNKIKITYDGSKTRIYINDVLAATESGTHTEIYNNFNNIGYTNESSTFDGLIDEVKFYNHVI